MLLHNRRFIYNNESMFLRKLKSYWYSESGPAAVLSLAVPLVLSSSSWTIQLFIDRLFISWYSKDSIAAALPAYLTFWCCAGTLLGIITFSTTLVAQYFSRKEMKKSGEVVKQSVIFSFICGFVFLSILLPFSGLFFEWIGHSRNVTENETIYFRILLFGIIPALTTGSCTSFFSGIKLGYLVLIIDVLETIINTVLGYGLIFGNWNMPELGIAGAGIATVSAQVISTTLSLFILMRVNSDKDIFGLRKLQTWKLNKEVMFKLIRFGLPNGIMMLIEISAWAWFVLLMGKISINALAATNITFNINNFSFMPMLGFGTAIQALVGHKIGENKFNMAIKTTYTSLLLTSIYMGTICLLYIFLPDIFIYPYTFSGNKTKECLETVKILLRFVAVYTMFDMLTIVFAGALRGAGDTLFVMLITVFLSGSILIVPSYIAYRFFHAGLYSVWIFGTAYIIALGLSMYMRFKANSWQKIKVV